jgi:hypothetical protein
MDDAESMSTKAAHLQNQGETSKPTGLSFLFSEVLRYADRGNEVGVIRTAGMDFKMGMIWIDSSLARYPNTHDISRSGFIRQTQGRRSCSRVIRIM